MLEQRLLQLLDTEQLSSSKFADVIGVQRSSVSHILSGRNKPSFDFIQKTLKAFPYLKAEWLIMGEGKMYDTDEFKGGGSLFDQAGPSQMQGNTEPGAKEVRDDKSSSTEEIAPANMDSITSGEQGGVSQMQPVVEDANSQKGIISESVESDSKNQEVVDPANSPGKNIQRIVILYDDNTFDSFEQES